MCSFNHIPYIIMLWFPIKIPKILGMLLLIKVCGLMGVLGCMLTPQCQWGRLSFKGPLDRNCTTNPDFCTFNMAVVGYCQSRITS